MCRRAGQLKSTGERLPDQIALGVLTDAFPPGRVDEVLARTGRVQQRVRIVLVGMGGDEITLPLALYRAITRLWPVACGFASWVRLLVGTG
jgi:hypothetical protein